MSQSIISRSPLAHRVNYSQIAEILGVSRTHVVDRISKQPDFPKPIIRVSRQTVWWADWRSGR